MKVCNLVTQKLISFDAERSGSKKCMNTSDMKKVYGVSVT
jgi:hypothetical protein